MGWRNLTAPPRCLYQDLAGALQSEMQQYLSGSCDHVFHIICMSWTIHVGIVPACRFDIPLQETTEFGSVTLPDVPSRLLRHYPASGVQAIAA